MLPLLNDVKGVTDFDMLDAAPSKTAGACDIETAMALFDEDDHTPVVRDLIFR